MRIWIDGRAACAASRTGKGQWVLRAVSTLLKTTPLTILTDGSPIPECWQMPHASVRTFPGGMLWHLAVWRAVMRERPDIYIAPSSFIVPSFLPRGIRCIPVVHDLIAFHSDPHEWKAKWIERMTLGRTLRNAAHICTMSNATKADLLQQFPSVRPDGISTVYAGPLDFDPPRSHPDHRTILCPGTLCPRKNQLRLLQAYAGLPTELRDHYRLLLIGGRGWNDREIVALVQKTPGAQWLGYVPDKEYRALLSHCTILAFPSLYEGFGLPVLDALQRGIPVLTTNRGSLPEVAGDCAVMVDPLSVESIRSGLLEMLTDAALLLKLQQKGPSQAKKFSWERTADLLRSVLQ